MRTRLCAVVLAGSALTALVAGESGGPPAASAPATQATQKVEQPQAFLDLADLARRKVRPLHVKGVATLETPRPDGGTEEVRRVAFEMWSSLPMIKMKVAVPTEEVRLSDGKLVYTLVRTDEGEYRGLRRALAPTNVYHALPVAAVLCDAAAGYANLAGAVRFAPAAGEARFDQKIPQLKWFDLQAAVTPRHHLLAGTRSVKVGISAQDGLVRVLVAETEKDGKKSLNVIVLETVEAGKLAGADMTLPPEARQAQWVDSDTGQAIEAPTAIIAPAKS